MYLAGIEHLGKHHAARRLLTDEIVMRHAAEPEAPRPVAPVGWRIDLERIAHAVHVAKVHAVRDLPPQARAGIALPVDVVVRIAAVEPRQLVEIRGKPRCAVRIAERVDRFAEMTHERIELTRERRIVTGQRIRDDERRKPAESRMRRTRVAGEIRRAGIAEHALIGNRVARAAVGEQHAPQQRKVIVGFRERDRSRVVAVTGLEIQP